MSAPTRAQRFAAEFIGALVLVLTGCGTAVLSAGYTTVDGRQLGVGFFGVAAAFGLTVTVLIYTVGIVSGGHFNPAVTVGLAVAGRFDWRQVLSYVVAQFAGAICGATLLYVMASGRPGFNAVTSGFASNGYGDRSPAGYSLAAAFLTEAVMTLLFVGVILAVTDRRAPPGVAAPAIGLCLLLIHLVSIPVTNTSVNPARSLGPALFAGSSALAQLWLFLLAPLLGAALAGAGYPLLANRRSPRPE